ncbi:MAG: hypothetical protein JXA11_07435, partial [Phycisphaerae bacterium]|nr:hypothetical protein [Phycisphaerae bacterium]
MQSVSLDGVWELAYGPQQDAKPDPARWREGRTCIPATVPGNVELDLIAAGQFPADLQRGNRIY